MRKLIKMLLVGMIISFLGSLPPGTLNVTAMQLSVSAGFVAALWFVAGCIIPEIIYVRLSLLTVNTFMKQKNVLQVMDWITVAMLVALAISSLTAAFSSHTQVQRIFLSGSLPPFLMGLVMSAVNPVQIPFWLGWNTVLINKKVLLPSPASFAFYITGIGAGSLAGSCVFIFGGQLMADRLNTEVYVLQLLIGIFFAMAALVQSGKMIFHKNAVHPIGSNR